MRTILVITMLMTLTACVKKTEPGVVVDGQVPLQSYEDKARGVVCYKISGHSGISCLKLGQ